MPQENLSVISGAKRTNPWHTDAAPTPLYTGGGPIDYVCGTCGNVVAVSMEAGRLRGIQVTCRVCDSINKFR